MERKKTTKRKQCILFGVVLSIGVIVLIVGLSIGLKSRSNTCNFNDTPFANGVVVTNGKECASIGRDILKRNGSVADAAIAALFCEGVACFQSMGLGGGFILTMYIRAKKKVVTLDARESAPGKAYKDMYDGNQTASSIGGLAVAVPGELRGYWELHQKYGKLPWADLIQPTIELCRTGSIVSPYLANLLKVRESKIFEVPSLREILIDPVTNETWKEGDKIKRPKLAETLTIIAKEGADALYNGSLTEIFVNDIKDFGGIITVDDMKNYKIVWKDPVVDNLKNDMKIYSSPLPGAGNVLSIIMRTMDGFIPNGGMNSVTTWQRITESLKFAYGARTQLGDPAFVENMTSIVKNISSDSYISEIRNKIDDTKTSNDPHYYGAEYIEVEDHGTAHISIYAPNGDAISVTSTINLVLGAMRRSPNTGIILNDEMDDFSDPKVKNSFGVYPSPANYISPGKRPLSSMTSTIVVDKSGDVRLVLGAAGGTKITSAIALIAMHNLWFENSISASILHKRIHHQIFPMSISIEEGFNQHIIQGLKEIGHNYTLVSLSDGFAAATAIARQCGMLYGFSDLRRNGSVAGF